MSDINWYPGHMNKAKIQIQERLKLVDVVLEIRDARLPDSSRNPVLDQIIQDKKRIIVLNKADLADPRETKEWIKYSKQQGNFSLALDSQHNSKLTDIVTAVNTVMKPKVDKMKSAGVKNYTIRAMCIGIPNVGKSTILNKLAGKTVAVTGNKPGVTKNQNWIKTKYSIELLDTPGVLWPKISDHIVGLKLALSGAIKDSILNKEDIATYALDFFSVYYQKSLFKTYHLTQDDLELTDDQLLLQVSQNLGYKDDYERASERIINDVRNSILGRYTLDRIENMNE